MLQVEMSASARNTSGKGPMRQLRMQGLTPAVVYGGGAEAQKLQLETKVLMAQLLKYNRRNILISLKIDSAAEKNVTIAEIQTDPVKDTLVHVDFCEIDLGKDRAFNVPVTYQGIPKGVDLGGEMVIPQQTILIEGKPLDIPDELVVDVKDLDIGDSIKCGAIAIPEGVKMLTDAEQSAFIVQKPGVKLDEEEGEEGVADAPADSEAAGE
jgi:large subunit ribosomal protein L25